MRQKLRLVKRPFRFRSKQCEVQYRYFSWLQTVGSILLRGLIQCVWFLHQSKYYRIQKLDLLWVKAKSMKLNMTWNKSNAESISVSRWNFSRLFMVATAGSILLRGLIQCVQYLHQLKYYRIQRLDLLWVRQRAWNSIWRRISQMQKALALVDGTSAVFS